LDYPKLLLKNQDALRVYGDVVSQKQVNFERTQDSLVITDKHDMIGTHVLIYDTADLFHPLAVAAIRITYEDRATRHRIPLPIETYSSALDTKARRALERFRRERQVLVDCNAWFVNADYSHKNANLDLSEILYFFTAMFIHRRGFDHLAGATNERYKASRWLTRVGPFEDGFLFAHPYFPGPHKLILLEHFYPRWMAACWEKYKELTADRLEFAPPGEALLSPEEAMRRIAEDDSSHQRAA
jgi:hypothetical protein